MEITPANAGMFLVIFTIAFILMDEYIAKPIRRARLEKRALTDPKAAEAIRISNEVAARHGKKHA